MTSSSAPDRASCLPQPAQRRDQQRAARAGPSAGAAAAGSSLTPVQSIGGTSDIQAGSPPANGFTEFARGVGVGSREEEIGDRVRVVEHGDVSASGQGHPAGVVG
jgi:hypothetical protein